MSAPKVASIPDRQAAKGPDNGDPTIRSNDRAKRRLAMAASVMTPTGGLGVPATTATLSPTLGG